MYFQKYCPRFTNALVSNVKIRKGSTLRDGPFNLKGGGYGFFLKKYSDFGGGKKNNLIQSFCHIT
jgi:hypothetical protein